jgi:TPR repeat protein
MGILYRTGNGVVRSPVVALAWFDLAVRHGRVDAAARRDALSSELGQPGVIQALALVAAWQPGSLLPTATGTDDPPQASEH